MSYKKIAMAAEQAGLKALALTLLKNEDSIKDQVPILLTMREYSAALSIAVSNCEADIVYGIISEMRNAGMPVAEVLNYCTRVEGATSYLLSYAHERRLANPSDDTLNAIYDFVHKMDPHNPVAAEMGKKLQQAGVLDLEEYDVLADALHMTNVKEALKKLNYLVTKTPKNAFLRVKPFAESHLGFLEFKAGHAATMKKKGTDVGDPFLKTEGIFEAIMNLTEKKDFAPAAEAMAKKLRVDTKYNQMIKLRAAAKTKEWGMFLDIIKKEKPKLTPQYFARTCIEFGNNELATTFIKQVPVLEEKITMLLDIEYLSLFF